MPINKNKTFSSAIYKSTEGDKRSILSSEVSAKLSGKDEEYYQSAYLLDYDSEFVYYEKYEDGKYCAYKTTYTMNGLVVTLGEESTPVQRTTVYEDIPEMEDEEESMIEKALKKFFSKYASETKSPKPLIKQFDDEEMVAIEPLYIAIGDIDGVGDTYASPEVCYDMVNSFNKAIEDGKMKGNYFHKVMTDDFTIVKAWVNEVDCVIGDTEVKEGLPLVKIKFNNEKAYDLRKSGQLRGVSIGARATWEEV